MRLAKLVLVLMTLDCSVLVVAQEKATPSPGKAEQRSPKDDQKRGSAKGATESTLPADSDSNGGSTKASDEENTAVKIVGVPRVAVETTRDPADWVIWGLTILLFLVGAYQIVLLRGTLNVTRVAAEAAKQSADALVRADRAWLLIRPDKFHIAPSNRFDWVVVNVGRSTAKVLETSVRCRTDISYQRRLPPMPEHNQPIVVHRTPIAPGETLNFWCGFDAFDPAYNVVMYASLTQQNIDDMLQGSTELVAYGYVRYEDAFGMPHESRFCSYFAPYVRDFRINLQAPEEYHRCD